MTQPPPGYRPYQPMQPMQPMPAARPPRRGVTSILTGLLALVAAGGAIGGSFGTISTYRDAYAGGNPIITEQISWWHISRDESTAPGPESGFLMGLVLVLAAVLLVAGAIAIFVAAARRAPGITVAGRSLTVAGVGVLTGAALLELLRVIDIMGLYNARELRPGESLEYKAGLGLYLPLGALVVAIVAAVLAHVGPRGKRVEPNTPKMGFPAPYGYQQAPPVAQAGQPGVVLAPGVKPETPPSERATEVNVPTAQKDDDGEATQVVSNATAGGAPSAPATQEPAQPPAAPVVPPAPAAAAWTELPPTPAATGPASPSEPAPASESPAAAGGAASTQTPASAGETPAPADQGATPAQTPATGESSAPTPASAPASETATPTQTPAPAEETATQAETPVPASEAGPPSGPAQTSGPAEGSRPPGTPASLSDFPAAPPAPELSTPDGANNGKTDGDKK